MTVPAASGPLLLVEDDVDAREALAHLLELRGWTVIEVGTLADARVALQAAPEISAVILDLGLPDGDGMDLLAMGDELPGEWETIVLTGDRRLDRAAAAMEAGAFDFIPKPLDMMALDITLTRLTRRLEGSKERARLRRELAGRGRFEEMIGRSPAIQAVYRLVERVAPSRLSVFIVGDSGTGKELLARAVHARSKRRAGPFVAINCGALPATLVDSELFGHEKGAFTGAQARREGVFEQADGGTLFLDELPEMPIDTQVHLLRALETGTIRRVGGNKDIPVDVRIVCATNREPEQAIAGGRLREDLYFRLNGFPMRLPPLGERGDDVILLAEHFLALEAAGEDRQPPALTGAAVEALQAHSWPGNIRELRNVMGRASVLADGPVIKPEHLHGLDVKGAGPKSAVGGDVTSDGTTLEIPFGSSLLQAERHIVEAYLAHHQGHRERTARALGITPKTLYNKLKAWGIDPGRGRRGPKA